MESYYWLIHTCDLKPAVYPCAFKNQIQYKEAEGSSYREGSYPETPGTPKVSDLLEEKRK